MSIGQRALWFEQNANPAGNAYNLGACLRFKAPLDPARINAALAQACERHPLLRARFDLFEGEPCWRIAPEPLRCAPLSAAELAEADGLEMAGRFILAPYDLAHEHPFRFGLVPLADGACLLAIACHHIVADLHSLGQLMEELDATYTPGQRQAADPIGQWARYEDFCDQQRSCLSTPEGAAAAAFWRQELAAIGEHASLGDLASGMPPRPGAAARIDFAIPPPVSTALASTAKDCGASVFAALLTAFQALLAHHCGRDTVLVGAPSSGRNGARFRGTLGYFVNLLPMVCTVNRSEPFAAALARNGDKVRQALLHGQLPYAQILQGSARQGAALVQATLTFQKTVSGLDARRTLLALGLPGGGLTLGRQWGEALRMPEPQAQFPVGIAMGPVDDRLAGCLQYDPSRVAPAAARQFLREWLALVEAGATTPGRSLSELLADCAPRAVGGAASTLLGALEEAFIVHATRTALVEGSRSVTYRELELRSRSLAASLQQRGIGPGHRVAVVGQGSIGAVIALVAVLRSGAAFVPMDADLGADRLRACQQAARVSAVLAADEEADASCTLQVPGTRPLDAAWLMFTSGTTGRPKAAVVLHEAALLHARGIVQRMGLAVDDRVLQFASFSFDEHAEEIFPTLLAGACLVCMPKVRFEDPQRLLAAASDAGITVLHLPTSYWHLWVDELAQQALPLPPALRVVNAGGEQASLTRLRQWAQAMPPHLRWFNSYGLTEAAVTSLLFELAPSQADALDAVPVGEPLPGMQVRIVDDELLLGGPGVGSGYFDAPEATAARYVEQDGVRWLRTGDLARIDGQGQVVIVGRRDRATKLRGMRVDLAEAEAVLAAHPAVLECVVVADSALDAHIVLRAGSAASADELRSTWHQRFPDGPTLGHITFVDAIPRTAGRKPDHVALQAGRAVAPLPGSVADDAVQATVDRIFTQLLQRPLPDRHTSFFALGGHSLLAMRAVAALRRELGVAFSVADFLAQPTPAAVAALGRERSAPAAAPQKPEAPAPARYPLSHAQRRALVLERLAGPEASRVRVRWHLRGEVDAHRLQQAWRCVLDEHPLLRTTISEQGNVERDALEREPPLQLAPLPGGGHLLAMEASMLAVDGGSLPLILESLVHAYANHGSPRPRVSYREYAAAEARWLASAARDTARHWWARRLAHAVRPTRLACFRQPGSASLASRTVRLALSEQRSDQARAFAAARGCSVFTVLLSAFLVHAGRHAGEDHLLLGIPVSLRDALGVGDVVGPTLNPLPFAADVIRSEPFTGLVQRVQALLAAAFDHAPLPWEEIAASSPALQALQGRPLPLQFIDQSRGSPVAAGAWQATEEAPSRDGTSPVDLLVGVQWHRRRIVLEFEYRRGVLADAEAVALARAYRVLLSGLLQAPGRPVGDARMLSCAAIARALAVHPPACGPQAPQLLHEGMAKHARERPHHPAIACGSRRITYAGLAAWSDAHAARLIAAGVRSGDRVAVVSRKGVAEVVAACAVLKAGAAYVPIAHGMPAERARRLVQRAQARVITGDAGAVPGWARDSQLPFVPLGPDASLASLPVGAEQVGPGLPTVPPEASAYILFTSGTTGEPKGVELAHRAVMTTVNEMLRRFDIGHDDVLYRQAALEFDLSVFDLFGAFTAGATLAIPESEARTDAFAWAADVVRHGVTTWNSVPSALDMLLEAAGDTPLPSLRRIFASGDWVGLDLPERVRAASPDASFVALGGATEAAIWSNCEVVQAVDPAWHSIPYGRALAGQSMFVCDPGAWPVPPGVTGEIWIGGAALAKGYWADPERTASRFTTHPLTHERVYRTGDLGRYLPDGRIEFLGRVDGQVKVRGVRVNVAEIEAVLAAFPGVGRAVVVPVESGAGNAVDALAAYVVARAGIDVDMASLQGHAERHLPAAMRPSAIRRIEAVPVTPNGKLDWKALPRIALDDAKRAAAPPASPLEVSIAAVWRDLLQRAHIDRHDNFFAVGGHSLLAVRMLARVRCDLGPDVPLAPWLDEPTVARLAQLIEGTAAPRWTAGTESVANLRRHVALAEDLRISPPRQSAGSIFVTGATGMIGRRVVARLLRQHAPVVCLVRTPQAAARLRESLGEQAARLCCVTGDLALPRLGLGEPAFDDLAAQTASVFHIGAQVNLMADYAALQAANVLGTHEVIRLAALAGAQLHHVSSVGVLPYGAGRVVREDDPIDADGRLLSGYCQTKWVAEQLVRAATTRGLRATILRPGLTVADAPAPQGDLLSCVLALSRLAGSAPALDMPVDLVTADHVADAIVHLAKHAGAATGTFHLVHPQPPGLLDLLPRIRADLPLLPFGDWQKRLALLIPTLQDQALCTMAALIAGHDEASITPARIDCTQAQAALSGSGIECPPVDQIIGQLLRQALA